VHSASSPLQDLRCLAVVEKEEDQCLGGERTGGQVLKRALEAPVRQIAENSAVDGEMLDTS
jgi:chaperonin GroEL